MSEGPLLCLAAAGLMSTGVGLRISPHLSPLVRAGFKFWLFWLLAKAGLDWLGPGFSGKSLALFGLRLLVYLNAGFSLVLSCTPLKLAVAGSWFLRPFLGPRWAGRLALGVALIPHWAPLMLAAAHKVKFTVAQRASGLNRLQRSLLLAGAVIRSWQAQMPGLALALASRWPDLDGPVRGQKPQAFLPAARRRSG